MYHRLPALNQVFASARSITRNPLQRAFSSNVDSANSSEWHIATLADGTVACWHPEKTFPYEHSRPVDLEELANDRKELRALRDRKERDFLVTEKTYGKAGPSNHTLREIFHTGKTEFATRTREERLYATSAPLPKHENKQ